MTEREIEILQRLSGGLSDQEIADKLYLSLNTIKWYNRQIYGKLGVSNRTQAIAAAQKSNVLDTDPAFAFPRPGSHNLPAQTTVFIGRQRESGEVKKLLQSTRLLTLTGAGGIGKTRLALQIAADVAEAFPDGIYFVELAPLAEHSLVAKTIAAALGVFENTDESLLSTLKRTVAQRELLLVIDNFEHVINAAPIVAELLTFSARLKILVTSRESLRLSGEQEYPVPPLSLPDPAQTSVQKLTDSEAGSLFVQRAQMTWPHFRVSDENAPAIAEICNRLDGLPLAIELAAARCKLLTPQALLARLDGSLNERPLQTLRSGARNVHPRHRTLRDSIEWSYQLLNDDEKTLFARLAVFRGSRSLDAVQVVCGEGLASDVFDGLASLVDKSLVRQTDDPSGEPRFSMLEMIHEYALERLEASSEAEMMRQRHTAYFVALAERAEPELRLTNYDYWGHQFTLDLDNIRAVLARSLTSGNVVDGVRLASAFGLLWFGNGHHLEGSQWTQQLLARLAEVPIVYHSKFLIIAGHMAMFKELGTPKKLFERALLISRQLGDNQQIAWSLTFLSYSLLSKPEVAIPLAEEAVALFRQLAYLPGIAQALNVVGEIARNNGDDHRARLAYQECLSISEQTGEKRRIGYMWQNLAFIAQHEGDYKQALDLGFRTLGLAQEMKNSMEMAGSLEIIAGSIAGLGQPERAARLLGAAENIRQRLGAFHQPSNKAEIERTIVQVHAQVDELTFQTAWEEGRLMTAEQAIADALSSGR